MTEEVQTEVIEEQEEKDWNKEKQRADMEHANFMKERSKNEQLSAQIQSTNDKISQLEELIKVNQKEVEIAELDPLRADVPDLVKQNEKLIQRLKGMEQTLSQLQGKTSEFEKKELERRRKDERDATINRICKPLDEEFGAKYRTKAVTMAEELVNDGKENSPSDALEAYQLLLKCYKKIKSTDETKTKNEQIPVDTGKGAFSFIGTNIKEGSLDEVAAQMRKAINSK